MNSISPYIRVALDIYSTPGAILKPRVIFDYELLYVKEGKIRVTINNNEYIGIPGDIFIFRPKIAHSFEVISSVPLRQPHVHFSMHYTENSKNIPISFAPLDKIPPDQMHYFEDDLLVGIYDMPDHIRLKSTIQFENMLFEIIREYGSKMPLSELHTKALLIKLLVYLLRKIKDFERIENANYEPLMLAKQYIETNYFENINLEHLAKLAGISKFYFSRLYKEAFNISPIHYLTHVRISKAEDLLKYTIMPISQISEAIGYKDYTIFIRAFKQKVGIAPSEFRKQEQY